MTKELARKVFPLGEVTIHPKPGIKYKPLQMPVQAIARVEVRGAKLEEVGLADYKAIHAELDSARTQAEALGIKTKQLQNPRGYAFEQPDTPNRHWTEFREEIASLKLKKIATDWNEKRKLK
ncbi:MAG: hypothetical protein QXR53_04435 [Candidatus Norongarragalinales archaeon]